MKKTIRLFLAGLLFIGLAVSLPKDWLPRPPQHWAQAAATDLKEIGVALPWDNPEDWNQPLTRGELAQLCVGSFAVQVARDSVSFSDVPPEREDHGAITAVVQSGWLNGFSDQTFRPDGTVSRFAVLRVLSHILQWEEGEATSPFTDITQDSQHRLLQEALERGILTLPSEGTFRPTAPITRAEAMQLFATVLQQQEETEHAGARACAASYLTALADPENFSSFLAQQSMEAAAVQQQKRQEILPFLKEQKAYQPRQLSDLQLTIQKMDPSRVQAHATYHIRYGNRTLQGSNTLQLQQTEQGWRVTHSSPALAKDEKIRLVWEYASKPEQEYTHQNQANVVSPTWFRVLSDQQHTITPDALLLTEQDGESLYLSDYSSHSFLQTAKKRDQEVWALCSNGFDPDMNRTLLTNPDTRLTLQKLLLQKAAAYGLEGINIDFENMYEQDRDLFTQFVEELSLYAKECGLLLSVDVTKISPGSSFYSLCYDRPALYRACDYLILMAYDQHARSSKTAGSVAQLNWTEQALQDVIAQVGTQRLILGVPFYTRIWEEQNGSVVNTQAVSMEEAERWIAEKNASPSFDEEAGQHYVSYQEQDSTYHIWLEDETSLAARFALVKKYNLSGIAAWSGGYEKPEVWDLFRD